MYQRFKNFILDHNAYHSESVTKLKRLSRITAFCLLGLIGTIVAMHVITHQDLRNTIGFFVYNLFHKTSPLVSSFKNLYLITFFRWRASKKLPKILQENFKELYEFYKKEGILFHFEAVYNQVQNQYNGKSLQSFYYYSKNALPSDKDNKKNTNKKPQTSYAQLFKDTCNQRKEQESTDIQNINFFPKEIRK